MVKFSFILCVFNGEKTINNCINSILNQTYSDFELIIINDGSLDNTLNIINLIKDNRIKLVNQKNHGLSYSRNVGIKNSKGKYILFVDSDDTISNNLLDEVNTIIDEYDLILFSYKEIRNILKNRIIISSKYPNKDNISEYGYVWNKVYKSKIIKKNKLSFNNELQLVEDLNFNKHYLKYVNKIGFITKCLYFYNRKDKKTLSRKYYDNFIELKEINIKDKLEIVGFSKEYEKHLYLDLIISYIISSLRNGKEIDLEDIYNKYKDKINNIKDLTVKEKIYLYLLRHKYYKIVIIITKLLINIYNII